MLPVSLLSGVAFTLLGHRSHGGRGSGGAHGRAADPRQHARGALRGARRAASSCFPSSAWSAPFAAARRRPTASPRCSSRARAASPPPGARRWLSGVAVYALSLLLFPFGLMENRYLAVARPAVRRRRQPHRGRARGRDRDVVYMRRDLPTEPPVYRLVTNGYSMSGTALGVAPLHEPLRLVAGRRAPGPAQGAAHQLRRRRRPPGRSRACPAWSGSTWSTSRATSSRWAGSCSRRPGPAGRSARPRPRRGRAPVPADDGGALRPDHRRAAAAHGAGVVNLYTLEYFRAAARAAGAGRRSSPTGCPSHQLLGRRHAGDRGRLLRRVPRLLAVGRQPASTGCSREPTGRCGAGPRAALLAALAQPAAPGRHSPTWASRCRSSSGRSSSATPTTCATSRAAEPPLVDDFPQRIRADAAPRDGRPCRGPSTAR